MSKLTEQLELMGCDMEGALNRFLNDEEFYEECYGDVLVDPAFGKLKEALEAKDAETAFQCAHTLKGVISNMGLTSMYDIIIRIVEPLRNGNAENLMPIYDELMKDFERYKALV